MTALRRLYTADEAATELGVPAATIRRWHRAGAAAADGVLPSRGRNGQQMLFRLSELEPLAEEYHARRQTRAQAEAARP